MRSYHVGIASLVARADHKWIDNLLSQHSVPGVTRARQGVSRKISLAGLVHIALARQLIDQLGLTAGRAVTLAGKLCEQDGRVTLAGGLEIRIDLAGIRRAVEDRVAEAAEVAVPARRGRPPARMSK